ncbi:MAG: hypothetical protein PHS82_12820 [Lachnospiraceae bacterium]|nr:hypothetical protein [Lachnospiraceae bacterium]
MNMTDGIVLSFLACNGVLDLWKRKVSYVLLLVYGAGAVIYGIWEQDTSLWQAAIGLLPGLLMLLLGRASREAVGYGDGLVVLVLGLYTGIWAGMEVLFLSFFFSALWAIALLIFRKGRRDTTFPFVPFLLLGYIGRMVLHL